MVTFPRQPRPAARDDESLAALVWLGRIVNIDGAALAATIANALAIAEPLRARHPALADQHRFFVLGIFLAYAATQGLTPTELASLADAPAWLSPGAGLLQELETLWVPALAGPALARGATRRAELSPPFVRRTNPRSPVFHTVESNDLTLARRARPTVL